MSLGHFCSTVIQFNLKVDWKKRLEIRRYNYRAVDRAIDPDNTFLPAISIRWVDCVSFEIILFTHTLNLRFLLQFQPVNTLKQGSSPPTLYTPNVWLNADEEQRGLCCIFRLYPFCIPPPPPTSLTWPINIFIRWLILYYMNTAGSRVRTWDRSLILCPFKSQW
jgi:hypothetical protein